MQGRPLRGAPVLILSDLICDTLHIRHLSVSEPLSNISKKILAQPNQAKKETKPGNFPAFKHGPPDIHRALCRPGI